MKTEKMQNVLDCCDKVESAIDSVLESNKETETKYQSFLKALDEFNHALAMNKVKQQREMDTQIQLNNLRHKHYFISQNYKPLPWYKKLFR